MVNLSPLTELEAVNLLLESVGEMPVQTLNEPSVSEVSIAVSILRNTSRTLQSSGWSFNQETNYPLALSSDNKINLPENTLKVFVLDRTNDVVQRGKRLYDKTNHKYTFDKTQYVDIAFNLAFDELPQVARNYITQLACVDFQKKILGADTLVTINASDLQAARTQFLEAEDDVERYSIFDSYDVARPILRNQNPLPRGGY